MWEQIKKFGGWAIGLLILFIILSVILAISPTFFGLFDLTEEEKADVRMKAIIVAVVCVLIVTAAIIFSPIVAVVAAVGLIALAVAVWPRGSDVGDNGGNLNSN